MMPKTDREESHDLAPHDPLVLNHFVSGDDKSVTPEMWSAAVRTQYDGPLAIGRDLMSIPLA